MWRVFRSWPQGNLREERKGEGLVRPLPEKTLHIIYFLHSDGVRFPFLYSLFCYCYFFIFFYFPTGEVAYLTRQNNLPYTVHR